MPLRPDFSRHQPDPRFDSYRQRVGRLLRGDAEVGYLLVEVEPYSEQVNGHLWWRRWGPTRDVLWLDTSEDELLGYSTGQFEYYGERLRVLWTDTDESRRLRATQFGT